MQNIVRSFAARGDIGEEDLVDMIFGTQASIEGAVQEFNTLGHVSAEALESIRRSAGPAGNAVADLVRTYFDLSAASQQVADAQAELNALTDAYAETLRPVNEALDEVRDRQRQIRDEQSLEELGKVLQDPRAEAAERELARLQIQEIRLEQQQGAIEEERDVAVDAAQQKIAAAQEEAAIQQVRFDLQQRLLDQQLEENRLVGETLALRERLAAQAEAEEQARLREEEERHP